MNKILGYKLDNINGKGHMILEIPMPAEILSVLDVDNDLFIYSLVDDDNPDITPIDILVIGTGNIIKEDMHTYKFVGTVKSNNSVIHIFYRYVDILGDNETNKVRVKDLLQNEYGRGGLIVA